MKIQQFLAHHGVAENPFGQEDAQADHVFRQYCLDGVHHPAWDKIFGQADNAATSVVFGEKGAGKTALRLQIVEKFRQHNQAHPDARVFVIEYDDFNPFLDSFRERLHGRKKRAEKALSYWRLWDHMDAILALGVRRLAKAIMNDAETETDGISVSPERLENLNHLQRRDVLLLSALYDHQLDQPRKQRWQALRKKLNFPVWMSERDRGIGIGVTLILSILIITLGEWKQFLTWWAILILILGWLPFLKRWVSHWYHAHRISRQVRVFDHQKGTLQQILSRFPNQEIAGQPLPTKDRSEDRYELLLKFQAILKTLGYENIVVLVDRVDEPHLINGSAERMRDLLWPMFDNKFLKHPGMCFKMLLPIEVVYYLNREKKAFYDRSRLDKQNLITSLEWTGESLYDVANDRIKACTATGNGATDKQPVLMDFFEEKISEQELLGILSRMRVPRHLFKFLYRVLVDHCNRFTDDNPSWKISRETLQAVLAVYLRDLEAFDRGMGTG